MSQSTDERVRITTYVPRWQKERWADDADQLDMSQSEFLRTMVQAGRRGFVGSPEQSNPEEGTSAAVTPGGEGLEETILTALRSEAFLSWDDLVEALNEDFEERLEATLDDLQDRNRVRYAGRHGGYTLVGDDGE